MAGKLTLLGRLGSDPEMRYTPSGKEVTNISLATDRTWLNSDGERQKETTWWRVTFWGKSAATINKFFAKGDMIFIEGRLAPTIKVFETRDGGHGAAYEVTAENWEFVGKTSGNGSGSSEVPAQEADDEIPF